MRYLKHNSVGNNDQETLYVRNTERYGSVLALSQSIISLLHVVTMQTVPTTYPFLENGKYIVKIIMNNHQ